MSASALLTTTTTTTVMTTTTTGNHPPAARARLIASRHQPRHRRTIALSNKKNGVGASAVRYDGTNAVVRRRFLIRSTAVLNMDDSRCASVATGGRRGTLSSSLSIHSMSSSSNSTTTTTTTRRRTTASASADAFESSSGGDGEEGGDRFDEFKAIAAADEAASAPKTEGEVLVRNMLAAGVIFASSVVRRGDDAGARGQSAQKMREERLQHNTCVGGV